MMIQSNLVTALNAWREDRVTLHPEKEIPALLTNKGERHRVGAHGHRYGTASSPITSRAMISFWIFVPPSAPTM